MTRDRPSRAWFGYPSEQMKTRRSAVSSTSCAAAEYKMLLLFHWGKCQSGWYFLFVHITVRSRSLHNRMTYSSYLHRVHLVTDDLIPSILIAAVPAKACRARAGQSSPDSGANSDSHWHCVYILEYLRHAHASINTYIYTCKRLKGASTTTSAGCHHS